MDQKYSAKESILAVLSFDKNTLKKVETTCKNILPSSQDIENEKRELEEMVKELQSSAMEKRRCTASLQRGESKLINDVSVGIVANIPLSPSNPCSLPKKRFSIPNSTATTSATDSKLLKRVLAQDKVNMPIYEILMEDRFVTNTYIRNFDKQKLKKTKKEHFEKELNLQNSRHSTVGEAEEKLRCLNLNQAGNTKCIGLGYDHSMTAIKKFSKDKLKHTETMEKLHLPSKADIESEKEQRDRIYPQEVLGFYSELCVSSASLNGSSNSSETDILP